MREPKVGKELVAGISRRLVKALQDWHDKSDTIATMHRLMEHVSFHQARHPHRVMRDEGNLAVHSAVHDAVHGANPVVWCVMLCCGVL